MTRQLQNDRILRLSDNNAALEIASRLLVDAAVVLILDKIDRMLGPNALKVLRRVSRGLDAFLRHDVSGVMAVGGVREPEESNGEVGRSIA